MTPSELPPDDVDSNIESDNTGSSYYSESDSFGSDLYSSLSCSLYNKYDFLQCATTITVNNKIWEKCRQACKLLNVWVQQR